MKILKVTTTTNLDTTYFFKVNDNEDLISILEDKNVDWKRSVSSFNESAYYNYNNERINSIGLISVEEAENELVQNKETSDWWLGVDRMAFPLYYKNIEKEDKTQNTQPENNTEKTSREVFKQLATSLLLNDMQTTKGPF